MERTDGRATALHLLWSLPSERLAERGGPVAARRGLAVLTLAGVDDPAVGFALLTAGDPRGPGAPGPVRRGLEAALSRVPLLPLPPLSIPPAARVQVLATARGPRAGLDLGAAEPAAGVAVELEHVRSGRSGRLWARVLAPDGRPTLEVGGRVPRSSRALLPFRLPLSGSTTWSAAHLRGRHRVGPGATLDLRLGPAPTALSALAEGLGLHRARPLGVVWTEGAVVDLEAAEAAG